MTQDFCRSSATSGVNQTGQMGKSVDPTKAASTPVTRWMGLSARNACHQGHTNLQVLKKIFQIRSLRYHSESVSTSCLPILYALSSNYCYNEYFEVQASRTTTQPS